MDGDQKHAIKLMYWALCDFVAYCNDPNIPLSMLSQRAAQAALVAESAFPELKE